MLQPLRAPLITLLTMLAASRVHAETKIRVDARGEACDAEQALLRVRGILGRDVVDSAAQRRLVIHISDEQSADVTLVEKDGTERGPRTLRATSCRELEESLAVVIATMLRSLPVDEVAAVEPVDEAPVVAPTSNPPEPATVIRRRASVSSTTRIAIDTLAGLGGAVSRGGVQAEVLAGLRLRDRSRSLGLEVAYRPSDEVVLGEGLARIDVSRASIELVPCIHRRWFGACVTAAAGWIDVGADGLMDPRPTRLLIVTTGARVGFELPLTRAMALRGRLDVDAALVGARLLVDDMPVWRTGGIGAAVGIDIVAQIP